MYINIDVQSELSCGQPIWLLENIHMPCPCFLGSFSGRNIKASNKRRGAVFLRGVILQQNPGSLLHLTPEIVDRLFNAYQRDLPRKVDFVDEVERWKIRWALVDDKLERLLDTLHATNRELYSAIYTIISILLTMAVSSATSERSFSVIRRVKPYLRSNIGDELLSILSLMNIHRHLQVEYTMIIDDFP